METYTIQDIHALQEFAAKWVSTAVEHTGEQATVCALFGDLGAGKTAFTKAVGAALGVTQAITSPTFVIQKTYNTSHDVFKKLVHIDAYRFEENEASGELQKLGWGDTVSDSQALILVEWGERITDILPEHAFQLHFTITDTGARTIESTHPIRE